MPFVVTPMLNNSGVSTSNSLSEPLALHIRSLRQWYGECGISQDELSALAGISTRVLKRYESARELPRALACLLAVALALQVSPEHLLDPRGLARLKEQIERRRRTVSAL